MPLKRLVIHKGRTTPWIFPRVARLVYIKIPVFCLSAQNGYVTALFRVFRRVIPLLMPTGEQERANYGRKNVVTGESPWIFLRADNRKPADNIYVY